jgi:4-hydroxy-tetrahydrodipicolinate synthase
MIKGSLVALVTPMAADESVDYEALNRLLDLHLASNTAGVVVGATTGEASTLNVSEQTKLISHTVKYAGDRIPVIAGIGANSTYEAIELATMAKECGAVSGLAVTPYYIRPNQRGMIKHFEEVAHKTSFPQILYNIPSRTSVDMHDSTILKLAENELIVGLKDATSDFSRAAHVIASAPPHFACYSGDDPTALAYMLMGGHGTISVVANIIPETIAQLCTLALDNRVVEARVLNASLIPLYDALSCDTNPMPIKHALASANLVSSVLRSPLVSLDGAQGNQLIATLKNLASDVKELSNFF